MQHWLAIALATVREWRERRALTAARQGSDVFLSYSHSVPDAEIAVALQHGLARLGKRWNRTRALRVFRDQTDLSASPDLWSEIEQALANAKYFVLLASPRSAASQWVVKEIEFWREHKERTHFLIALVEGDIAWPAGAQDFVWSDTDALPPELSGYFEQRAPLWVDLRPGSHAVASTRDPHFTDAVATLSAPIHGVGKDELIGADIREQRRFNRIRNGAIAALALLFVGTLVAGYAFLIQRNTALHQRDLAETRALVSESGALIDSDPRLARLLAATAMSTAPDSERPAATAALRNAIAARGRLVFRHPEGAQLLAEVLRPGGGLATAAIDNRVRLWDMNTGLQTAEIEHDSHLEALTFSPDGEVIAGGYDDGTVQMWDGRTGAAHGQITGLAGNATQIVFSPDGHLAAVRAGGDGSGEFLVWEVATGHILYRQPLEVSTLAISPDSRTLAIGMPSGRVQVLDAMTGVVRQTLAAHSDRVWKIVFSPDGSTLATAGVQTVRLWDAVDGTPRQELSTPGVVSVGFAARGRILVTGGGSVMTSLPTVLWDAATGAKLAELSGYGPLAIDPSGTVIVTGSTEGELRLWDVDTRMTRSVLSGHAGRISGAEFSSDGSVLVSIGDDDTARTWDPRLGSVQHLSDPAESWFFADLDPTGRIFATGGHGVRIWSTENGDLVRQFGSGGKTTVDLFGPDGGVLVTDVSDRMQLWDVTAGTLLVQLPGRAHGPVHPKGVSRDGAIIVATDNKTVQVWDSHTRTTTFEMPIDNVSGVALSPDARIVAIGRSDTHAIDFIDPTDGHRLRSSLPVDGVFSVLGFSPDGQRIVTVEQHVARLWDLRTGRAHALRGHGDSVLAAVFSPDGSILATGSADKTIRLWDVATGQLLGQALTGHTDMVRYLAFSQDGRSLVTAGDDRAIRRWDISALGGDLVETADRQAGHGLTQQERDQYLPNE